MKNLLALLTLCFICSSAIANNPINSAFLELEDQGTFGELYSEYRIKFRISLVENSDVSQVQCLIDVPNEGNLIDVWVNLDGTNNGVVSVSTDPVTGETIIDIGIYELPLSKNTKVAAKSSSGTIYPQIQVI